MDLLKAAIAERKARLGGGDGELKRKAAAEPSGDAAPLKKFKTRGELEAERRAQAEREKSARAQARHPPAASAAAARASPSPPPATAAAAAEASPPAAAAASASSSPPAPSSLLSALEVKRRLRGYGEPLTLFGESDGDRFARLRLFELQQHERMTSSHGRGNALAQILQHDVQSEIDAAMMRDMEQRRKEGEEGLARAAAAAAAGSGGQAATAAEAGGGGGGGGSADGAGGSAIRKSDWRGVELRREDFESAEEFVLYFFKRMLSEWESELDARPTDVRMSERGKMASAVQKQTRAFLKPLLKLLKARSCAPDILRACELLCSACLRRDYNGANEAYLTMAIGNAPWPMGVTMVSIHERAGRTKLFSNQVAHVLNDETQRKYIQSVKRLMTYCQEHYPANAHAQHAHKEDS